MSKSDRTFSSEASVTIRPGVFSFPWFPLQATSSAALWGWIGYAGSSGGSFVGRLRCLLRRQNHIPKAAKIITTIATAIPAMAGEASDLDPPNDPEGVDGNDVDFVILDGGEEGEAMLVAVAAAAMGTMCGGSLETFTWLIEKLLYS